MKRILLAVAALAATATVGARADVVGIQLGGAGGISGTVVMSYGAASDTKYPGQGFKITSVSGTFSDATLGIFDAPITSLVQSSPTPPLDPPPNPNLLAPHDFSHFAVATGLSDESHGFITYDNLFWPDGAPPTASSFDGAGGFLDIYGLLFTIGGTAPAGTVVDLFNNGVGAFSGINYGGFGVVVATSATALDSVTGGVTATAPEPSTWAMMLLGFVGLGFAGYRKSRKAAAITA
jgi:PEP-CTERM motif